MKRLHLRLIIAITTFAIGITATFAWHFVSELTANEIEVPSQPLKVCEVHGVVMLAEHARVKYGSRVATIPWWDARRKLFPNSNRFLEKGCEHLAGEDAEDALIYYCQLCRAAHSAREHENGEYETYMRPCGSN